MAVLVVFVTDKMASAVGLPFWKLNWLLERLTTPSVWLNYLSRMIRWNTFLAVSIKHVGPYADGCLGNFPTFGNTTRFYRF